MKKMRFVLYTLFQISVFLTLTVLTQVGGIAYVLALYLKKRRGFNTSKMAIAFVSVYALLSIVIVPPTAPLFGRKALPYFGEVAPLNVLTCVFNRQYVHPDLYDQLFRAADHMQQLDSERKVRYLDACFPFFDGFPLLPHLSHHDGRKIDLAFYYMDPETNQPMEDAPSFIGYGVYEEPRPDEPDTPQRCEETGSWWYSAVQWIVPQWNKEDYKVDKAQTRRLIQFFAEDSVTSKIFIEPHLKYRWNLTKFEKIRFHGCRAVRHDDHIHIEM